MVDIVLGLFIGLLLGANIGILGTVFYAAKKETVRKLKALHENNPEANKVRRISASDIFILHACDYCDHEWKEHPLAVVRPNYCPKCGRQQGGLEREVAV